MRRWRGRLGWWLMGLPLVWEDDGLLGARYRRDWRWRRYQLGAWLARR